MNYCESLGMGSITHKPLKIHKIKTEN